MILQELTENALALSADDRLALISAITQSLQAAPQTDSWNFLAPCTESWRQQLYIKGSKLPASDVWGTMLAENMTPAEAAEDWDLPIEAVHESIKYCESHQDLLNREADQERKSLENKGVCFAPAADH